MKNVFCCMLMLLYLQSVLPSESCEETGDIFAMFGEEENLQLSVVETQKISKILWITSRGLHFATSRPGGPVEIRANSYEGRLNASSDGSLIIKGLKMNDSGIIKATIRLLDGEDCSQTYDLRITGRCGETKKVSAQVGGNVTLPGEGGRNENLFWERPAGVHFDPMKPGGYFNLRDRQYNGKLLGSQNGSLTITNISPPDQGVYRAVRLPTDGIGCMQLYNVSVSEKNMKLDSRTENVMPGGAALVTLALIYACFLV